MANWGSLSAGPVLQLPWNPVVCRLISNSVFEYTLPFSTSGHTVSIRSFDRYCKAAASLCNSV